MYDLPLSTPVDMLVDPITGVLSGCWSRVLWLIVSKFVPIQSWEEYHVLVKQYKSDKNLDCCFLSQA